jgi:hypothetical protein
MKLGELDRIVKDIGLLWLVLSVILIILPAAASAGAENSAMLTIFPAGGFAEGWVMEGRPALFTEETLFDHIDGEAELYFPYGFDLLAAARYVNKATWGSEIAVDVYRMGSLLDAFGIWSNYRKADIPGCALGDDCVLSSSQILFYQDRYFVRLQATGTPTPGKDVFLACGQALSRKLPQGKGRPGELEILRVRGVVPKTERYIPQSVMGYPFFRRGLTAEANLAGQRAQVFVVIEDSAAAARKAFDQYLASLKESGRDAELTGTGDRISLDGSDPLYGKVIVEQSGRHLIGAIRLQDTAAMKPVIEELKNRTRSRP